MIKPACELPPEGLRRRMTGQQTQSGQQRRRQAGFSSAPFQQRFNILVAARGRDFEAGTS
jgi:hypothetical protein